MSLYSLSREWPPAVSGAALASLLAGFTLVLPAESIALSFDEAVTLATRNTPQLIAAQLKLEAAQQAAIPASELPDPKLAFGVENFPISGADRYRLTEDFMTMQRIAVMHEIPNRDKRNARVAAAEARILRSEIDQRFTALRLQRETATAWIRRYIITQQLVQLDQLLAENRHFDLAVRTQLVSGRAATTDIVMPRQEAAMLEERRDELLAQQTQAIAVLRRWIGEAAEEALEGAPPHWTLQKESLEKALHRHPELQTIDAMASLLDAEVREAQSMKKSDWGVELAYQRRGEQFGNMVSVAVTVDLPWFAARRQDPQIASKLAERASLDAEREAVRQEHLQTLENDWAELERLDRALERNRDTLQNLAREKIDLALAAYQGGGAALSEVITARREHLELKLKQTTLEGERAITAARLYYASENYPETGAAP